MRYQKLLLPAALLAAMTITVFALDLRTTRSVPSAAIGITARMVTSAAYTPQTETKSTLADEYLSRRALWPRLRSGLSVLGDRLERPGKERMVMTGTLSRASESVRTPFVLTRESPGHLRLEEQNGDNRRVIVFDVNNKERITHESREANDIETLSFDTAEYFFTALARGAALRHLGDGFILDKESAVGQSYNLYEITTQVDAGGDSREQTKIYGLNSDTKLLEVVKYETERDGALLKVEVWLSRWQGEQGQMSPRHIERKENGRVVLSLDINTVTVGPRLNDGAFTATRAN